MKELPDALFSSTEILVFNKSSPRLINTAWSETFTAKSTNEINTKNCT